MGPGYANLEAVDAVNWPLWLLAAAIGICFLGGIIWAAWYAHTNARRYDKPSGSNNPTTL